MSRYTFSCDSGPYSGGDLALSSGLGLMAGARNLLGSLHLFCFSLTHLSIWEWEGKKEMGGGGSPTFHGCVSLLPSLPHISMYLQGILPCVWVSHRPLSPSLFHFLLWEGQEVEERKDEEKVRWGWEETKWITEERRKRDRWSFLVSVFYLTAALCGLCKPNALTSRSLRWAVSAERYFSIAAPAQ